MTAAQTDGSTNWSARAALWSKVAPETVSPGDTPNIKLIAFADIREGHAVLDLASGTGEPAIRIALRVGQAGRVTASDMTPEMLEAAQARARRMALGQMDFQICSMDDLPFAAGTFDRVTCRFGLMFAEDPVAVLTGVRRVLKPGGKACFMVHAPPERNQLWAIVHRAASGYFGLDNRLAFDRHYRFSQPGALAGIFRAAGFSGIDEAEVTRTEIHEPDGIFWTGVLERSFDDRLSGLSDEARGQLDAHVRAAFQPCLVGGRYHVVIAQRMARGLN